MARGRPRKPTKIKELTGNPGKRQLDAQPAKKAAKVVAPTPPAYLDKAGLAYWRSLAKLLKETGNVAHANREPMAAACVVHSRWVDAEANLKKFGIVMASEKGGLYQSPYLAIANRAMEQLMALLKELGLTPRARSQADAAGDGPADPFMKFLTGKA